MSQWVKDNDVLNKVLFVPPIPRYGRLDFPDVLVWLGERGERFPCLVLFPVNRKVRNVIIYFHGNGCDLSGISCLMRTMMIRLHVGIVAPEYPGYGISEGVACESSAKKCGRLTLEFVVNDLRVPLERIVIFGTSIGTGICSWLAKKVLEKEKRIGSLILQSPFTSIKAVLKGISIFESQVANFFAQVGSTFVADRFTNLQCLRHVTFPLLVLHGAEDDLIPVTHGKTIYEASKANLKKIVIFPNVGHNDFEWLLVIKKVQEFLERVARYYGHGRKIKVEIDTKAVRARRRSPSGNVEQKARERARSGPKVTNLVSYTVGTIFGGAIGMAQALIPESKEPTMDCLSGPSEPRVREDIKHPPLENKTWRCPVCTFINERSLKECKMCFNGPLEDTKRLAINPEPVSANCIGLEVQKRRKSGARSKRSYVEEYTPSTESWSPIASDTPRRGSKASTVYL